jgi:hypothetical protein
MDQTKKRILGRQLAVETTIEKLEAAHGGRRGARTWNLRYPPDRD